MAGVADASSAFREEKHCRFCNTVLPDWRPAMTPDGRKPVTPFMRVSYGGKSYKVRVGPGPEGLKGFEQEVRRLLKLPEEQEFDVIFHCRAPVSGNSSAILCLSTGVQQVEHTLVFSEPMRPHAWLAAMPA
jgi:hypothetical protein